MDGTQFDDLSRTLARGISRRSAIKALAGGLLGALGVRGAAAAQVSQSQCGNTSCKNNPGKCNAGCVCCASGNGNSRCRPPGSCPPGDAACPPNRPNYDPVRGCRCTSPASCPQPAAGSCQVAICSNDACGTAPAANNVPCGPGKVCCAGLGCLQAGTNTNCSGCGDVCDGPGETCGGGGQAQVCGCTANGTACGTAACGTATNNCGQILSCGPLNGNCPTGQSCSAGVCACPAGTCGDGCSKSVCDDHTCKQAANSACSADGDCCSNVCVDGICLGGCVAESEVCDGSSDCCGGAPCVSGGGDDQYCCASGTACGTNCCPTSDHVCDDARECCAPRTGCDAGECGDRDDGCGGTITCDGCIEPETCGGGGTPGTCGCTDDGTACGTYVCGELANNCGALVTCGPSDGECPAGQYCSGGECFCPFPTCGEGCTLTLCGDDTCRQGTNSDCASDEDCCSNACVNGVCSDTCVEEDGACDSASDCCNGSPCVSGGGENRYCCGSGIACGATCCTPDAPACSPVGACIPCETLCGRTCCAADIPACSPEGTCVQCVAATDCPLPEDPCQIAVCLAGNTCGSVTATNDSPCGDHRICCAGSCLSSTRESTCGSCENQCRDDTPFCSEDGICVECFNSDQCFVGQRRICSPDNTCVECASDGNCYSSRPFCTALNSCGECRTPDDCALLRGLAPFCQEWTCDGDGSCTLVPLADNTGCGVNGNNDRICCGGSCTDAQSQTTCGACNVTCTAAQFCVPDVGCVECQQPSDCPPPTGECDGTVTCYAGICFYGPAAAGTVCRPATGECDVAETCDGITRVCPPDDVLVNTVCRETACGEPAICPGGTKICPPNPPKPAGLCNAPTNPCYAPTFCNGVDGGDCPQPYLRPERTVCPGGECRFGTCTECSGAAGSCDVDSDCCAGRSCFGQGFGKICV